LLNWCKSLRARFPVVLPEYVWKYHHPYHFIEVLTTSSGEENRRFRNGSPVFAYSRRARSRHQRILWNSGCAPWGNDLPAAIGASFGGKRRVICIAGDGSLMMNLQELQTVAIIKFPSSFLYWKTRLFFDQADSGFFFNGHRTACDPKLEYPFLRGRKSPRHSGCPPPRPPNPPNSKGDQGHRFFPTARPRASSISITNIRSAPKWRQSVSRMVPLSPDPLKTCSPGLPVACP